MKTLWLFIWLIGCVAQPTTPPQSFDEPFDGDPALVAFVDEPTHPRPVEAPDVVIITIAGHQTADSGEHNSEYLAATAMIDSMADVFRNGQRTVETRAFTDEFFSWEEWNGEMLARGFLDLAEWVKALHEEWVIGFDNPTRVVLVGHGHGVVWAHMLTHLVDIPVDFLIDLDGDSHCWDVSTGCADSGDDWETLIQEWSEYHEVEWSFDISQAQEALSVPGVSEPMDIEDVVSGNVVFNLEFHANDSDSPLRNDRDVNLRHDGSRLHLYTNSSEEDKATIYQPWSDAMQAVNDALEMTYFPEN